MKKVITIILIIAMVVLMVSCAAMPNGAYSPDVGLSDHGSFKPSGIAPSATPPGSSSSDESSATTTPPTDDKVDSPSFSGDKEIGGEVDTPITGEDGKEPAPEIVTIPAGQLTAAEWVDKEHYDSWVEKCYYNSETQEKGLFFAVANESVWNLPYADLYSVKVVDSENKPVAGVKLSLKLEGSVVYTAVSDAKGDVSLFAKVPDGKQVDMTATYDGTTASVPWTGEKEQTIVLDGVSEKQNIIEIMFLIDTTGSMGDELRYLQAEIDDVIEKVKESVENATIRIALLFYRDHGDEYVTRYFDFNEDIAIVKKNLSNQRASGGGDLPEAVEIALSEAVSKQWTSGNVTKLLFHVLDAPPHTTAEIATTYRNALYSAAEQGIRIIPVASSGIDKNTEYLLRMEALLTGGTYTFLTNDSGIGNSHLEPTVDGTYVVELLNSMLVRLIRKYYTGEELEPIDWRQEVSK